VVGEETVMIAPLGAVGAGVDGGIIKLGYLMQPPVLG